MHSSTILPLDGITEAGSVNYNADVRDGNRSASENEGNDNTLPYGYTVGDLNYSATAEELRQADNNPGGIVGINVDNNTEGEAVVKGIHIAVKTSMKALPRIKSDELKLIGRCVTFIADVVEHGEKKEYYYEGMVALVTRDTVVMTDIFKYNLDTNKFTERKDSNRVRILSNYRVNNSGNNNNESNLQVTTTNIHSNNINNNGNGFENGDSSNNNDNNIDIDNRNSNNTYREGDNADNNSSNNDCNEGNHTSEVSQRADNMNDAYLEQKFIAYHKFVTFSRKKIRGVEFAPDHPIAGLVTGRDLHIHPFLRAIENKSNKSVGKSSTHGESDNPPSIQVDGEEYDNSSDKGIQALEVRSASYGNLPPSHHFIYPSPTSASPQSSAIFRPNAPLCVLDILKNRSFSDNKFHFLDLERCRMFVRRYIVHTSRGNNPKEISLKEFIAERVPWTEAPVPLLRELAREELALLINTDNSIQKYHETRLGAFAGEGGGTRNSVNTLHTVTVGRRFMLATFFPARTCYFSICSLLLSVVIWFFSALGASLISKGWVVLFSSPFATWLFVSASAILLSSIGTAVHSLTMTLPPPQCPPIFRFIFTMVALVVSVVLLGQCISLLRTDSYLTPDISLRRLWMESIDKDPTNVCLFMNTYMCSGFSHVCNYTVTADDFSSASVSNSSPPSPIRFYSSISDSECPKLCNLPAYSSPCIRIVHKLTSEIGGTLIMLFLLAILILSADVAYLIMYLYFMHKLRF